jgi:hypothetical protein
VLFQEIKEGHRFGLILDKLGPQGQHLLWSCIKSYPSGQCKKSCPLYLDK